MGNKEDRDNRIIQQFEYENPQFQVLKKLGQGQHGIAYELEDGNAVKFTIDKREIRVCNSILGLTNNNICNVYEMGELYDASDERLYKWIIQERLFDNANFTVHQSVNDFRHTWFGLYSPDKFSGLNEGSLWEIYNKDNKQAIQHAKGLLTRYIQNINLEEEQRYPRLTRRAIDERLSNSLMFFDFIQEAYQELFKICPFGRIDLNDGNFLFDKNGHLKTFDILAIDE